jgi:nitroreductase
MTLDFLLQRRSVSAALLGEPGPDAGQLDGILRAAIRVPDHKALAPWRFIVFEGAARQSFGARLAAIHAARKPDDARGIETERSRLTRAPLVIAVISSPKPSDRVPEWEQLLSAGAACQNILHAAHALGFAAQWVTEWISYDDAVKQLLNLADGERVAGFVYIGTASEKPMERPRAEPKDVVSHWPQD